MSLGRPVKCIQVALWLGVLVVSAQEPGQPPAAAPRPTSWATPIDATGAPNLHRVSNSLYRSAQPSAEGMRNLERLGIKTVVNLRSFHSDRNELAGTKLAYEHLWMKAWHPEEKEVVQFLQIVLDEPRTPVLVHCQHGADRTGTLCAAYRIVVQGWSKDDAIREMTEGGYGFHAIWDNLIQWVRDLDVDRIREQVVPRPTDNKPTPDGAKKKVEPSHERE